MSMAFGSGGGPTANMNVTPFIDILLVLLIIFMVINPPQIKGLDALVPQPPKKDGPQDTVQTIVVEVVGHGAGQEPTLKINTDDVIWGSLQKRLTDIFKTRAQKVLFVRGDDNVPFADVANVIDIAHASGVDKVGLITAKIESVSGNI
ncbi:MAG: ExbD/TolR family protein [Terriglobales bacterium]|nr:biopolymer transporter ExbD [Terriglobales bacterium]